MDVTKHHSNVTDDKWFQRTNEVYATENYRGLRSRVGNCNDFVIFLP